MQNSNQILSQILRVVGNISTQLSEKKNTAENTNQETSKNDNTSQNKSSQFSIFGDLLSGAKNIKKTATDIDSLSTSLNNFSKTKVDEKKFKAVATGINILFDSLDKAGTKYNNVSKAIRMFSNFGETFKETSEAAKNFGISMMLLGGGLLSIGGSLALTGLMLGTSPIESVGVISLSLLAVAGTVYLLSKIGKEAKDGVDTVTNIGKGLGLMSLGILAFVGTSMLVGNLVGSGGVDGMLIGLGIITASTTALSLVFYLLGSDKLSKNVKQGATTASAMGIGLAVLSLGLLTVGLTSRALLGLGASENSENTVDQAGNMLMGLGLFGVVAVGSVGLMYLLGNNINNILLGTVGAVALSVGMMTVGFAVNYIANSAKNLQDLGKSETDEETKKSKFAAIFSGIGGGLGAIGTIFISSALLFTGLGLLTTATAGMPLIGIGIGMALSASLILFAKTSNKLAETAKIIPKDFGSQISFIISSVINGTLDGLSSLGGGETGIKGLANNIKNTAKLMQGIAVLGTMSMSLSMFAKAISAFASVSSMKVIEGYDENGKPIFGETIDVSLVGNNIATTISSFLTALISSTDGLTTTHTDSIKRMAKTLTGKNGMLSAIIQFSDVLETYAKFGPNGEIGYTTPKTDENGNAILDANGNPILETKSVSIESVTNSIVKSISLFSEGLSTQVVGLTDSHADKLKNLSEVLIGKKRGKIGGWFAGDKPGLLEPINAFSDTLNIYAKYGKDGEVPILDDEGNPTGKTTKMTDIVSNITTSISLFTSGLFNSLKNGDALKNADDVADYLKDFGKITNSLSELGVAQETLSGIDKTGNAIDKLATSINKLIESITGLDTTNLTKLNSVASNITVSKTSANSSTNSGEGILNTIRNENTYNTKNNYNNVNTSNINNIPQNNNQSNNININRLEELFNSLNESISNIIHIMNENKNMNKQYTFDFANNNEGVLIIK